MPSTVSTKEGDNVGGKEDDNTQVARAEEEDGAKPSGQEQRQLKNQTDKEEQLHQEFENFLSGVQDYPDMYSSPRLQYLRDFCSMVKRFPELYISQDGDDNITMPLAPADRGLEPTQGYVEALAALRSGSEVAAKPILSVLAIKPGYRKEVTNRVDAPQNVKLTEVSLVDGSGERIHARLNNSLTEEGCRLKRGDKIRLELFTELRFRVNNNSARVPGLLIHEMHRVGNDPLPDDDVNFKRIMPCSNTLPREHADNWEPIDDDQFIIDPRIHDKPVCTDSDRKCAIYGIRMPVCVCEAIPVKQMNLARLKNDCYFATDPLDDMTNSHKRNMIYWWYATNVYSIAGAGVIGRLPLCLEYAIREAYPNPDGVPYTGCKRGSSQPKRKR